MINSRFDYVDMSCDIWHADEKNKKKFTPKYYTRIPLGKDKYRYFYSKEDYQAYLKNKKQTIEKKTDNVAEKVEELLTSKKVVKKSSKNSDKSEKSTNDVSAAISSSVSEFVKKGKKAVSDAIEKAGDKSIKDVTVEYDVPKDDQETDKSSETSKPAKDVAKKVLSWMSGGIVKLAVDEIIDKATEKKRQEKEQAEAERRAAEEAIEAERKAAEEAEKQRIREEELAEQQEAIDELQSDEDAIPGLDIKDEPCTKDEDMEATNPYYNDGTNYAYSNNCAYCTAAYELRQRGYDVEAADVGYETSNTLDTITDWYEGEDLVMLADLLEENNITKGYVSYSDAAEMIEKDLLEHGDGARGQFLLYWAQGGGHSVVWEVQNGDVVLRDCQLNETVEIYDYLQYANNVAYFRTDNVELSDKIKETVVNTDESRYVEDHW